MRKLRIFLPTLMLVFALVACETFGQLGQLHPIAQLHAVNLSVRATCTSMDERQRLTPEDSDRCLELTDQASDVRRVYQSSGTYSETDVRAIHALLLQLEAQLKEKDK